MKIICILFITIMFTGCLNCDQHPMGACSKQCPKPKYYPLPDTITVTIDSNVMFSDNVENEAQRKNPGYCVISSKYIKTIKGYWNSDCVYYEVKLNRYK